MENRRLWAVLWFSFSCALVICTQWAVGWAQVASAGFSLEQVMSSPFPTNLVTAQQQGRIAWLFASKGEHKVWIADAPNFESRQGMHYTGEDGMPLASLKLAPDGRTAVYARGTEANGAGESADPPS